MATDEEYLDNLLKSMTEAEPESVDEEDKTETSQIEKENEDTFSFHADDLAEMPDQMGENSEPVIEEIPDQSVILPQDLADMSFEQKDEEEGTDDTFWDSMDQTETEWDEMPSAGQDVAVQDMDVTEMIDHMEEKPEDLLEINDLLKQADSNSYVDTDNEDLLALLGSMQEEAQAEPKDDAEDSIFWTADDGTEAVDTEGLEELFQDETGVSSKEKKKKRKDGKKKLFGKKDKKSKEEKIEEQKIEEESEHTVTDTELSETAKENASIKKPGRLAEFWAYITQEEEAGQEAEGLDGAENESKKEIKEKKKKKEKSVPKKKADKKGKAAEKNAKKQEKKALREQKKQAKLANQPKEADKKILSKRSKIVLIAFCASLLAAVFALSTFLPDYVDKREAREAFYAGDYESVYKLLYGKQLNAQDRLIYERVEMVLSLQRKLDAYENNKILMRDTEALTALLEGVERYHKLEDAEKVGAQGEVDAIYDQMCGILMNVYGITGDEALAALDYDDANYSRVIYNLVSGIGLTGKDEERQDSPAEEVIIQDLLPEEEDMIGQDG